MEQMRSPWEERFTWFWFCKDEILDYTQEDFDRRARELHDRGVTVAINFTMTHFRIGFYPYWDVIHEAMRKFAVACHKYGIRVVEHHSTSLIHDLLSSAGWERFEEDLGSFSSWTEKVDTWIEVPRFIVNDPKIDGKRLYDMYQIDGRTGEVADTVYQCRAFCFNNPDFREMYFNYMKKLIETVPIDGIMNDDVQYFGDGHACTCAHCRKLFKEQTGYDLPQPEDWDQFYGDYTNPVFIAWKRFRHESAERLYRDLTKLYEELGVKLIRPNYSSDVLIHNETAYGFDCCCDLWDFIFQENCYSAIMHASYLNFMAEALHRYAAAARHGAPSMSMFYPDRADSVYFAWALSHTWGQMYTGTGEGVDITGLERKYRMFETQHAPLLGESKKMADAAFYFSMQTRDFTKDAPARYTAPFVGAMQAACLSGLGVDMTFESDSTEELSRYPMLVLACVAMLSDEELARFAEYVKAGGKLVIYGDFAEFDQFGKPRAVNDTLRALGISAQAQAAAGAGDVAVRLGDRALTLTEMKSSLAFTGGEPLATLADGTCVGIHAALGAGEVFWVAAQPQKCEFQDSIWSLRRCTDSERAPAQPSLRAHQLSHTGALLNLLVGERKLHVTCEREELLAAAYSVESGATVHIVNLEDTIPPDDRLIGHEDVLVHFTDGAEKLPAMQVKLHMEWPVKKATLYTPEDETAHELTYREQDGALVLDIPGGLFAGYALISLEK